MFVIMDPDLCFENENHVIKPISRSFVSHDVRHKCCSDEEVHSKESFNTPVSQIPQGVTFNPMTEIVTPNISDKIHESLAAEEKCQKDLFIRKKVRCIKENLTLKWVKMMNNESNSDISLSSYDSECDHDSDLTGSSFYQFVSSDSVDTSDSMNNLSDSCDHSERDEDENARLERGDTNSDSDESIVFAERLSGTSNESSDSEESYSKSETHTSVKSSDYEKLETVSSVGGNIVFIENWSDESSFHSESSFNFSGAITEENCFRSPNRGTLAVLDDHDFSEDSDIEAMFSASLSLENLSGWSDIVQEGSSLSQGYINEGFIGNYLEYPQKSDEEKKENLRNVNEKWNNYYFEDGDKEKEGKKLKGKKVSFVPSPKLIVIHQYDKPIDVPSYDTTILDRLRFQRRIEEVNAMLTPFLCLDHRNKIIVRNSISFH